MTITPTSSLATALVKLQELVAASAAFQTAVGADSAAAAMNRIELDYVEGEGLHLERPFGVICESDHGYDQQGEGDGVDLHGRGELLLQLTANAEFSESHSDSKITFLNFAAQVIDEMSAISGQDENFPMRSVSLFTPATRTRRTERNEERDFWWMEYAITWGATG